VSCCDRKCQVVPSCAISILIGLGRGARRGGGACWQAAPTPVEPRAANLALQGRLCWRQPQQQARLELTLSVGAKRHSRSSVGGPSVDTGPTCIDVSTSLTASWAADKGTRVHTLCAFRPAAANRVHVHASGCSWSSSMVCTAAAVGPPSGSALV
jgi:hypothetical protein